MDKLAFETEGFTYEYFELQDIVNDFYTAKNNIINFLDDFSLEISQYSLSLYKQSVSFKEFLSSFFIDIVMEQLCIEFPKHGKEYECDPLGCWLNILDDNPCRKKDKFISLLIGCRSLYTLFKETFLLSLVDSRALIDASIIEVDETINLSHYFDDVATFVSNYC